MDCAEIQREPAGLQASLASPVVRIAFAGILGTTFIASIVATVWLCRSMSAMGEMPMPGGWSMSMMWTPTCGQTWFGAAAAFVRMWTLMMTAMMLPLSTPLLRQFGQRKVIGARRAAWFALLTGAGYWASWTTVGAITFACGNALAVYLPRNAALARLIPLSSGILVIIAGAAQFTPWKARRIACCCNTLAHGPRHAIGTAAACKFGFRLALEDACCCANLMAVLLVLGVMDLRAMAAIAAAMIFERLTPAGTHRTRGIGVIVVLMGLHIASQAIRALA